MKALIQKLVDRVDLTPAEVESAFETIFQGEATPAQLAAPSRLGRTSRAGSAAGDMPHRHGGARRHIP